MAAALPYGGCGGSTERFGVRCLARDRPHLAFLFRVLWTKCVFPKFMCGSPSPQCDGSGASGVFRHGRDQDEGLL